MKSPVVVVLLAACLALTGCEALSDASDSVREKFAARNEPRTRTFSASQRVVFDAVKIAASTMGFRQTRGGAAQGEFEGVSAVDTGAAAGSARQVSVHVRLREASDGSTTDVSVRFSEILEADSSRQMGMATETTMKDTPLYESFFRNVQQSLGSRPSAAPIGDPIKRKG
jgi:hypothetical protein